MFSCIDALLPCRGGILSVARRARAVPGQATIEAAVLMPVMFLLLLLLLQPGIVLYDRMVMESAASEGCRVLATKTSATGNMDQATEDFIRHRLGAIPQASTFHVHDGGCSWVIRMQGGEGSAEAQVSIENSIEPLPLIGGLASLGGLLDAQGHFKIRVVARCATQPDWVSESDLGLDPDSWIGAWMKGA